MNCLGDIAAESGHISNGVFVRWTTQLLLVTVQSGNADMYRRSRLQMQLVRPRASKGCFTMMVW